jgi:hypothetical protein
VAKAVEHLPSKLKALSSNPSTANQTKPNQNKSQTIQIKIGKEMHRNRKERSLFKAIPQDKI